MFLLRLQNLVNAIASHPQTIFTRGRHAGYVMDLWNFSSVSWNVPLYIVCLAPASK